MEPGILVNTYGSLVPNRFWKGQTRRKYVSDKGLAMCLYSGLCPSRWTGAEHSIAKSMLTISIG